MTALIFTLLFDFGPGTDVCLRASLAHNLPTAGCQMMWAENGPICRAETGSSGATHFTICKMPFNIEAESGPIEVCCDGGYNY